MKNHKIFRTAVAGLALVTVGTIMCVTGLAQAGTPRPNGEPLLLTPVQNAAAQTDDDDDEKLDESFRRFGGAAGAAYQCTPESEREKLVSDVRHAYSRIGQLFGTDRAFYFAVHFGHASDGPVDKANCPELLKKLRESVLVRRLAK